MNQCNRSIGVKAGLIKVKIGDIIGLYFWKRWETTTILKNTNQEKNTG